ncbi:hypothetical protein H1S01_07320 [Heliobacterium chlorum]|uniref:Uncharacterized protein n=1 Tax=Heliobacterium chlorum TaxID=2698 RepID=A0ABR7T1W7_HELCL|nr:hypothetical protein [Heliobacterium chlorum]MBC9784320.1 hypothetical protein [Heliobacterium chlorum]
MGLIQEEFTPRNSYETALEEVLKVIEVPREYKLKEVRCGTQNESAVWIFRYVKSDGNHLLGGEHYSFTVEQKTLKLLGLTWMDQRFVSDQRLPSQERTKDVAKLFLESVQPGLFERLDNHWIRPHDEQIGINGRKLVITGMKFKCYMAEDDTWAWVIVGPDENIITFEQGIKWENGRITEKWLHDSWVLELGISESITVL